MFLNNNKKLIEHRIRFFCIAIFSMLTWIFLMYVFFSADNLLIKLIILFSILFSIVSFFKALNQENRCFKAYHFGQRTEAIVTSINANVSTGAIGEIIVNYNFTDSLGKSYCGSVRTWKRHITNFDLDKINEQNGAVWYVASRPEINIFELEKMKKIYQGN